MIKTMSISRVILKYEIEFLQNDNDIRSMYLIIINGDLTAELSWPIKLIELSSFSHNHTKTHNFHVI